MNIIVISRPHGQPVRRSLHAPRHFLALGAVASVALAAAVGAGYAAGRWQQAGGYVSAWQARLADQHEALADVREQSLNEVNALSAELAELQSRMTRIDALGRKLVRSPLIDTDEFDFGAAPGRGGVQLDARDTTQALPDLWASLDALGERMSHREHQLDVLDDVMMEQQLAAAGTPAGSPINEGWMSSSYGTRTDPFTGEEAWHAGVDFAGRAGSPIHAVGAGVVTYAGKRWGYGQLVEITHGDGYVTRYGHNSRILVEEGDMVRRGDLVSEMGSSGRSTGPHVHLEVIKDGDPVNPWKYV
ncbi:MAG: M23 family metallopeptidase, partial [Halofilum sp. (in: g-proteobacteria)]